jgi:adenylate kinase
MAQPQYIALLRCAALLARQIRGHASSVQQQLCSISTSSSSAAAAAAAAAADTAQAAAANGGARWVFLGPPGVGKGTYASRVAAALGVPHIAAGDLVRAEIKSRTPLGKQVRVYAFDVGPCVAG